MSNTTASPASATLSGRELALKRRQAMAKHGKTGATRVVQSRTMAAAYVASAPAAYSAPASYASAPANADDQGLIARLRQTANVSTARARRVALSQSGKAALQKTASVSPGGRVRPQRDATSAMLPMAAALTGATATAVQPAGCGCGCAGTNPSCGTSTPTYAMSSAAPIVARLIEPATGRALARARRNALAQDGKAGLKRVAQATKIAAAMPGQDWQAAITKGATGRQISMQRRLVQSLVGRETKAGSSSAGRPAGRPAGRTRDRDVQTVPLKVEEGHTLSGQSVTGTMTDRSKKITGNEPGSCRAVTGTEYVGSEQFDSLCSARPQTNPPKVGVSSTLRERTVTGTEVGRSERVTGDEPGACRGITGTEYLSAERYAEFCAQRPAPAPAKIGFTATPKGINVSGTTVGRSEKVTGDEPGSERRLTGTGYMNNAPDTAPDKVAVTHTSQGKIVTGTSLGHIGKITGDEPGACRGITGTEYLATEHFDSVCKTAPVDAPRKVSVMSSRAGETVSGTEVGRSSNVTGDEPGSCRAITGNQYYNQNDFADLCKLSGPKKVGLMHTLAGRTVSGTEVAPSPKLSGDESFGCKPVTGMDYIGADQLQAVCPVSTQVEPVAKVAIDQTFRGQQVTGSYAGRSTKVTGNEFGGCSPISGTPYVGRGQYKGFCPAPNLAAQEARTRDSAIIPATAVTGDRPGAGGSVMTGDDRGACEVVSGTPYIGIDNRVGSCATSGRFAVPSRNFDTPARPPAPLDFSILSPARQAQVRPRFDDVSGSAFSTERITGPVNKAGGLITGTPEFRHRDNAAAQFGQQAQVEQAQDAVAARRLTGEGSEGGSRITGGAWDAKTSVTGTEGTSSLTRNQSMRGEPRGMGTNARIFREVVREAERPEVPDSRITGSSGNTGKGATVTLSGGARG
jgi:hypothetical protein